MSLSKEILQGSLESVKAHLDKGAPLDVIDEYGYTPLIHAIGAKKNHLIPLLLNHPIDINFADQSGTTPLHWAVDMNDERLTQLLLDHGADPNIYNRSGQPILFYPTLRKQQKIIDLLIQSGANKHFCDDYIMSKLLAHRFELQGYSDIVTPDDTFYAIDLEGFFLEFTLDTILDSLSRFTNSYEANRLNLQANELKQICLSLENASHLRQFKHFSIKPTDYADDIKALLKRDLLLLPVSFMGHAITFIKHGNLLAKCDRGVSKMTAPIQINTINNPNPLNLDFYMDLLYSTTHSDRYIKYEIAQILDLESYVKLPIKHQLTGNCSWANVESAIPTMLYMLQNDKAQTQQQANMLVFDTMKFYKAWLNWDKDRALEDAWYQFESMSEKRQKARAALLGAVLFQSLSHQNAQDLGRAKKILRILSNKKFHYIIRAYAKNFIHDNHTQKGKEFIKLLNMSGYPLRFFEGQ